MFITSLSLLSQVGRIQTVSTGLTNTWNGISAHTQRFAQDWAAAGYFPAHSFTNDTHTGNFKLYGNILCRKIFFFQLEDEVFKTI